MSADAWLKSHIQSALTAGVPEEILRSDWGFLNFRAMDAGTLVLISYIDGSTPRCEAPVRAWEAVIVFTDDLSHGDIKAIRLDFIRQYAVTAERADEIRQELRRKGLIKLV